MSTSIYGQREFNKLVDSNEHWALVDFFLNFYYMIFSSSTLK